MERHLRIIGHFFFLIFFLYAIVFSYERVLFVDSAYYLFKIINYEHLNIEYSRFPSVLTQFFTLIGVKLHLPLSWLIVCFSVSFVLVYYIVYLLSVYTFRNAVAGVTIVLVLCLSIRHSFFHIVTETHQALVYSCLFFAWIMKQDASVFGGSWKKLPNLLTGVLIICLAGYSHPVAYLAMLFCVLFFIIEKNQFKNPLGYLLLALVIFLGAVKYATTPYGSYEGQFLVQATRLDEIFKDFPKLFSIWFFTFYFKEMYIYPFFLMMLVCTYYLLSRQFIKVVFVPAYFLGFLSFTLIIFNAEDSRVMMERAFMPLALFAGIPFLNDFVVKYSDWKKIKVALIIILIAFSLRGIYKTSHYFSDRVRYMEKFFSEMEKTNSHKLIIDWNNTTHDLIYIPWAFGVETLLYSIAKDMNNARTVFIYQGTEGIDKLEVPLEDKNLFLCVHFDMKWDDSQLNKEYFNLPAETYTIKKNLFLK